MNELKQLQYKIPMIEEERQYRKLAEQIEKTVNEGRDVLTVRLTFRLSDEAMEALNDAQIKVKQAENGSFDYEFKIGGTD